MLVGDGTENTSAAIGGTAKPAEGGLELFGDDGLTFFDILDVINPLQHIPVVSALYRRITGDDIDPGARLAGGVLFGGPIGLAAAAVNVVVDEATGRDVGEHVAALFDDTESPETTAVADSGVAATERQPAPSAHGWVSFPAAPPAPSVRRYSWADHGDSPEIVAQLMREAEEQSAATRALEAEAVLDVPPGNGLGTRPGGESPAAGQAPSGASAAAGGWFADAMLTALARYRDGAGLVAAEDRGRESVLR